MTDIHGFEELQSRQVGEIDGEARLYRHIKTGARLLSVVNTDENKVFGITFRTPPADSTGVAHILEHSVLCGSRKFPVKDPFIRLAQGSLNTFLNAMTFPDKTTYPVASQNLQDFYNLIDVYMDTVLHPLLTRETFEQEGWHYELDAPEAALTYKGVVFNEMKGAYSSPNAVLYKLAQQALFPDTTYGVDSGGDPVVMPDLTYDGLKDFHATYYHPSNAWIYFYGDDDPAERLRLMNERLAEFSQRPVQSDIGLQPQFDAPVRVEDTYPAGQDADKSKSNAAVNWLLGEINDPAQAMALSVLDEALTGTPAAPLRRALTESGLGEDVISSIDFNIRQVTAIYGLKGINAGDLDKVEALVLDTLKNIADEGFDKDTVEAALNTAEFSLRENNTGHFPRGLSLMLRALTTWLYERDPLERIAFEAPLEDLKTRITSGERVLEKLIQKFLLDNPHRITALVKPDPKKSERQAEDERTRLDKIRADLSSEDLERLTARTAELKRLQNLPDQPEDIAKIAHLKRADLPEHNTTIPSQLSQVGGVDVLTHDLPTNGIVYLDLAFDLKPLSTAQLPLLDVFGRALLETGAGSLDFVGLTQHIARNTGGVYISPFVSSDADGKGCVAHLMVRSKVVPNKADQLIQLLNDVLLVSHLDNRDRIKQIVMEEKASAEARLAPAGHMMAALRVNAGLSAAGFVQEQISGLTRLFALRELAERIETDWPSVAAELQGMRDQLISKGGLIANITANEKTLTNFTPGLETLIAKLPDRPVNSPASDWSSMSGGEATSNPTEGFAIPASVNYVAKGGKISASGVPSIGAALVAQNLISTGWLWNKVRMQGGAYGGFCRFDRLSQAFTYISYRDPNLLDTLDIYDATAQHLKKSQFDEEEITRAIIGTIGIIDTYLLPDAKGLIALQRHLSSDSDEARQTIRDQVLATTAQDIHTFADALETLNDNARVAILGSDTALTKANDARGGNWLAITQVM